MIKLFVVITTLILSFTAQADLLTDPQLVAVQFFEYFNDENLEGLEDTTAQPFPYNINGKVTQYKSIVDAINFDGLRASGWAYSGINDNEVLVIVEEKLATVSINFSRYNDQGIAYDTENVIYQLGKVDGVWKIMTATIAGDITLGD